MDLQPKFIYINFLQTGKMVANPFVKIRTRKKKFVPEIRSCKRQTMRVQPSRGPYLPLDNQPRLLHCGRSSTLLLLYGFKIFISNFSIIFHFLIWHSLSKVFYFLNHEGIFIEILFYNY